MTTKTQRGKCHDIIFAVLLMCPADEKFDYRLAAFELISLPIYFRNSLPSCSWSRLHLTVWITRDVLLDVFGKERNWKKIWPWCRSAYIKRPSQISISSRLFDTVYIYIAFHWKIVVVVYTYLWNLYKKNIYIYI